MLPTAWYYTPACSTGKKLHVSGSMCGRRRKPYPLLPIVVAIAAAVSPLLETRWAQADSYDLRDDRVTPVKDQDGFGNCWAYAAMCSVESNVLTKGLVSDRNSPLVDLSECHLSRFYNGHDEAQPITGGNRLTSLSYFSRGRGPVLESQYPCPGSDGDLYADHDYPPQYWVTAQQWIDRNHTYHPATFQNIKDTIKTRGAVETGVYWDDAYYDFEEHTYYYDAAQVPGNHAISLVGWDDTKVTQSTNPGAWLVKDSWGELSHDNGYYWLSYDDTSAVQDATSYQTASANTYNQVFENQSGAPTSWWNHPYGAARFTTQEESLLKAVGFTTKDYGVQYDISVYDSWVDGRPNELLGAETGSHDWPGYYLVNFDTPIDLGADDEFVVVLHLSDVESGSYLAVDTTSGDPSGINYCSFDGTNWADMGPDLSGDNVFFLKAFVTVVPEPSTLILLSMGALTLTIGWWRRRR